MKKFFVFFLSLVMAGATLSSCTTIVNKKDVAYIVNKYGNDYVDVKRVKVGNKKVKFYPAVEDHRKTNLVFVGKDRAIGAITVSKTFLKKPVFFYLTKFTLKKALKTTGWGIADNRTDANFIIKADITSFRYQDHFIPFTNLMWDIDKLKGNLELCSLDNKTIYQKKIDKKGETNLYPLLGAFHNLGYTKYPFTNLLYKHLYVQFVNFLSSKKFIKAVHSHLDNTTKEK